MAHAGAGAKQAASRRLSGQASLDQSDPESLDLSKAADRARAELIEVLSRSFLLLLYSRAQRVGLFSSAFRGGGYGRANPDHQT